MIPPPDATREEIDRYLADARETQKVRRRSQANRSEARTCSSCGLSGHRRGDAVCPNYATLGRWKGERRIWRDDP